MVGRLLAKNPADRYPDAAAVAADLAPFTAGYDLPALVAAVPHLVPVPATATITRSESPPEAARPAAAPPPRNRRRWAAAVLLALLLGGAAAVVVFRSGRGTPAIDPVDDAPVEAALPPVAEPGEVRRFEGHSSQVNCVALTRDGKIAVSGGMDASVRVWDVATGRQLRLCTGVTEHVWAVAISPDDRFVLGGGGGFVRDNTFHSGNDFSLHLWDLATGKEIRQLKGHTARIMGVAFTPDGRRAVSCSHDHSLRVWDVEAASEITRLETHESGVMCLALSRDGRFAISGGEDRTVRLWDLEQGIEVRTFNGGHTNQVLGVALSPDGRLALSGGLDRALRLWDVQTGKVVRTFPQHPTGILGVAFSPDGRRALSVSGSLPRGASGYVPAGYDYVLRLWDVASGRLLHQFEGHTVGLMAGVFLPDGYHALTTSSDRTLRLWGLPEPLPISPFSAEKARLLQERWAKVSGQPAFHTSPGAGKLLLIPPGESLPGERHAQVTRPYYLAEHEVTVGQFRSFVEATGYRTEVEEGGRGGLVWTDEGKWEHRRGATWRDHDMAPSDDYPVTQVTWTDAARFCEWLSQKEGRLYRLPTEAEWEWACRAGSSSPYYFGEDAAGLDENAWHKGSGPRLHPVGQLAANPWGLRDLYGNAAEWCQDWYADLPPSQIVDPRGPARGNQRVIRGGSVLDEATSATREHRPPDEATAYLGFRVVCEVPEPAAPSPRSATLFDADGAAYEAWLRRMKEESFWPTHVHVHQAGGKLHFAAVALRDLRRRDWAAEQNLDLAAYRKSFHKRANEGAFPVSLCGYSHEDTTRFAALWSGDLHNLPFWATDSTNLHDLQQRITAHQGHGRRPDLVQGYAAGSETYFLTRFVHANGVHNLCRWSLTAEELKTFVESVRPQGYRPISLSAYPDQGKILYAVILLQDNPELRWQMRVGMSAGDFRREQDELTSRGYRPLLIGGHEEQGLSRWLAVWVADSHAEAPLPHSGRYVSALAVLDEAMDRFLREGGIRAGALAVVKDGKLILSRGYGHADREGRREVAPDTPFRLASLTKPITATAIRKLIRDGKLRWDTRVYDLLRTEPLPGQKLDPRWKEITVGNLFEHKGGWDREKAFDPMFRSVEIARALDRPAPARPDAIIRYMVGKPLQFDPGSRTAYSNFGYCLLGRVIEKVSGRPYLDYIQKEVLEPAGAKNVYLGRTLPADRDPREPFYDDADAGPNVMAPDSKEWVSAPDGTFYLEALDSHGGLVASAADMARFMAAYSLSGRPGDDKTVGAAFGMLPGTFTVAVQRGGGVRLVALFNRSRGPSGRDYFAIQDVLNRAADQVKHWPTEEVNDR
jgi:CubicO group peptidase (beta-lactamase class C family)/formylglycine-generating enzyme required for sulfatase activity